MTVKDMLARMDARELTEWQAFYSLEPWGEARADLRSGIVAAILTNVHRAKDSAPVSPSDFLLFQPAAGEDAAPAERAPPSGDSVRAQLMALFPPK